MMSSAIFFAFGFCDAKMKWNIGNPMEFFNSCALETCFQMSCNLVR